MSGLEVVLGKGSFDRHTDDSSFSGAYRLGLGGRVRFYYVAARLQPDLARLDQILSNFEEIIEFKVATRVLLEDLADERNRVLMYSDGDRSEGHIMLKGESIEG